MPALYLSRPSSVKRVGGRHLRRRQWEKKRAALLLDAEGQLLETVAVVGESYFLLT